MHSDISGGPASGLDWDMFMPGISIDGVIFGYHPGQLKILLLEYKKTELHALPGGFVKYDESLHSAADRIIRERSGLGDVYLNQFHTFGSLQRSNPEYMKQLMRRNGAYLPERHWLHQRFISIGYYALIDYSKARPVPDNFSDSCRWYDVQRLPELMLDHRHIVDKALETLKENIEHKSTGLNLLNKTFTMAELQQLYETILGEKLHRTGFHRKMLYSGRLQRVGKKNTGKAHRAPFLYRFKTATS